jgi:hypothetical protein
MQKLIVSGVDLMMKMAMKILSKKNDPKTQLTIQDAVPGGSDEDSDGEGEGPEKATRGGGGEWEPIKISRRNLAYVPKTIRNPSLLTRPRPPSYRQAIDLRNRARNCNESTERC